MIKWMMSRKGAVTIAMLWLVASIAFYHWGPQLMLGKTVSPDRQGIPLALFSMYFGAVMVAIFALAPSYLILSVFRREAGSWERYSLADFIDYYDYKIPAIAAEVRRVRIDLKLPEAEFGVEMLRASLYKPGEPLGIILFQVLDELGAVPPYAKEGGKPVLVLNGVGNGVMFNEKQAFAF